MAVAAVVVVVVAGAVQAPALGSSRWLRR